MNALNRNIRPPRKDGIIFKLPEIERFSLSNGLKIIFIKKDKLPIVQMNFVFNAGSKFDFAGKKGLANLLSMLIDEGAGNYNSLQLSDEFDKLGTHFNVYVSEDNLFFSLQTLSENFKRSAELASMVLMNPHLDNNDFERERRKIITRIIQLKDEPDEIADIVFGRALYGDRNPYAFPAFGYQKDLESISIEDIKKFYSDFIHPRNGSVIVVGDISKNDLQSYLTQLFSAWRPKQLMEYNLSPAKEDKPELFLVDKKDSVQSEIRIGHLASRRNEKDYYPKTLMNMILGGQFTSRINLNLREKNGYTYGATSRFNYFQESAFFSVSTSVNSDNTASAVKEIISELNGIKAGIKDDELEFAKSSIIRKFPSNFETYRQIASNLSASVIHSLPDDYFNKYIENIESVDLKRINDISAKSINTDILKIIIVGDKNKLKQLMEGLAQSKIIETDLYGNIINT